MNKEEAFKELESLAGFISSPTFKGCIGFLRQALDELEIKLIEEHNRSEQYRSQWQAVMDMEKQLQLQLDAVGKESSNMIEALFNQDFKIQQLEKQLKESVPWVTVQEMCWLHRWEKPRDWCIHTYGNRECTTKETCPHLKEKI